MAEVSTARQTAGTATCKWDACRWRWRWWCLGRCGRVCYGSPLCSPAHDTQTVAPWRHVQGLMRRVLWSRSSGSHFWQRRWRCGLRFGCGSSGRISLRRTASTTSGCLSAASGKRQHLNCAFDCCATRPLWHRDRLYRQRRAHSPAPSPKTFEAQSHEGVEVAFRPGPCTRFLRRPVDR